ncbi:MAG: sulfatase [Candidatus Fermentibacteraceae bacterium]
MVGTLLLACGGGERPPNVLLIIIDTLRADHLGCYGYHRPTSPALDSLASSGTRWAACQAQSSWTLPAMTTIFTGLSERAHGAGARGGQLYRAGEELDWLPELMSAAGYCTFAVLNAPVMDREYGFCRGLQRCDTDGCSRTLDAGEVTDRMLEMIDEEAGEPFFGVAHYFDPHWPYAAPDGPQDLAAVPASAIRAANAEGRLTPSEVEGFMDLYDLEIGYCDREVGRLLSGLRGRGLEGQTVVVVVADHGEEFLDHGMMFHGRQLYQETVHVPLIMSGPGVPEDTVVEETVGQYDILPTLMRVAGGAVPEEVQGVPLLPPRPLPERGVPSSGDNTGLLDRGTMRFRSSKVFWAQEPDSAWAYDLDRGGEVGESLVEPEERLVDSLMLYWTTQPVELPLVVEVGEDKAQWFRDMAYI